MIYQRVVAETGQVNAAPGGNKTIKEWITNSFINENSKVLEIGCTTGFNSIEIARYSGAEVVGIDISEESINMANRNIEEDLKGKVSFFVGDANNLKFENDSFTHVILGGHLPWVKKQNREDHVQEALRVLKTKGFLLTVLYFYKELPPEVLIRDFNEEFNTYLHVDGDYNYWNSLFDIPSIDLEYEAIYEISLPDETRKENYVKVFSGEQRLQWEKKVDLFIKNGKYINYFMALHQNQWLTH